MRSDSALGALIFLSTIAVACGDDSGSNDEGADTGSDTGTSSGMDDAPTTTPMTDTMPADSESDGGTTSADSDTDDAGTTTGDTEGDTTGGSTGEQTQDVTLQFAARVGDEDAVCGTTYPDIGAVGSEIELHDLRFYVSEVFLVDGDGNETEVMLEQDGQWQYQNVALLDFEDGTAACDTGTTAETNTTVRGTVPTGDYVGIHFTVGVPFELNHLDIDAATTEPPLNVQGMFWVWAAGHKYMRVDVNTDEMAPNNVWNFHLGAQGCMSTSMMDPPDAECSRPARVNVLLPTGFDPDTGTVVLDLEALYDGVDLTSDTPMTTPGCQSFMPDVNECEDIFPNLGLDWAAGDCTDDCSGQTIFSVD